MSRAYGVRLVGSLGKPATADRLQELLARIRSVPQSDEMVHAQSHSYDLKEIAHGIHNGEFEPYFQPKVSMPDGKVIGAEALARWRHLEVAKRIRSREALHWQRR